MMKAQYGRLKEALLEVGRSAMEVLPGTPPKSISFTSILILVGAHVLLAEHAYHPSDFVSSSSP